MTKNAPKISPASSTKPDKCGITKTYKTPAKTPPPPHDRNSSDGLAWGTVAMITAKMVAIITNSASPGGSM